MIIGISGRIGSGKDTFARFIQEQDPSWQVKKFAGKLKDVASLLTGVPVEKFEDQEFKKQQMPSEWGMTYREFLQRLGTDAIRDGLHTNAWVNALIADYKLGCGDKYPNWLITDVRFPNEAAAVKTYGGVMVRITRGNETPNDPNLHPSETGLDDYDFDVVIENKGTLEELNSKARLFLNIILYNYAR